MNLLFYDIETAGQAETFTDFIQNDPDNADRLTENWRLKCYNIMKSEHMDMSIEPDLDKMWKDYVAFYPEYAKVVCISVGYMYNGELKIKSFYGEELELLTDFNALCAKLGGLGYFLCGYNIKQFDNRFTGTRMLFNGIKPNRPLDTTGLKPWEDQNVDIVDRFKFGSYGNIMKFDMVCYGLGIPTPKDDISGKDVHSTFWSGGIDKIVTYCEKDVEAVAAVMTKLKEM